MTQFHRDNASRLEDIEGLLVTAQGLVSRFSDDELQVTKDCIRNALAELRTAQCNLMAKWADRDAD